MLVFSREPIPFTFPEDTEEPKTVWYIRPMTEKDWAVVQAQIARQKKYAVEAGRDDDDSETTRRGKDLEFRALASSIDRVENYGSEGTITDKGRIAEIFDTMSFGCYQKIGGFILSTALMTKLDGN